MKLDALIEQALEESEERMPRERHAPTNPFYNLHYAPKIKPCPKAIRNLDTLPRPLKPPGRS